MEKIDWETSAVHAVKILMNDPNADETPIREAIRSLYPDGGVSPAVAGEMAWILLLS